MNIEEVVETLQDIGIDLSLEEEGQMANCIAEYGDLLTEVGRRFVSDPENIRKFLFKVQEAMV